ncbi:MAG: helix-turn-helix transcriptional regulator [Pseudomonadota bacterium]
MNKQSYKSEQLREFERLCGNEASTFSRIEQPGDELVEGSITYLKPSNDVSLCFSNTVSIVNAQRFNLMPRGIWIALALEGRGTAGCIGHEDVDLSAGQGVILSVAEAEDLMKQYRKGEHFKCVFAHIDPSNLADDMVASRFTELCKETRIIPLSCGPRLQAQAFDLFDSYEEPVIQKLNAEAFAANAMIAALSSAWDDKNAERVYQSDALKLRELRDFLIEYPGQQHTLASLAAQSGMCTTSLRIKFQTVFGQSPIAFLRDVRMEEARLGLERGLSVSEAARMAGFRHQNNFSRAYRGRYGVAPTSNRGKKATGERNEP